jgi:opacity protein-like surface antigen
MKIICIFLLCLMSCATQAMAQLPVSAGIALMVNVGIGYSHMNLLGSQLTRTNLNGADIRVTADFLPRIGIKPDLGYVRASNLFGPGFRGDVLSYLGGAVFYPTRHQHLATYTQVLVGGARVNGESVWVNDVAWAFGGGAEYRFSGSVAIRTGLDYLRAAYFDTSGAIRGQNDIRTTAGFVYFFGRKR